MQVPSWIARLIDRTGNIPFPVLLDGAMGTELQRRGLAVDGCAAEWNLSHPEETVSVHSSYINSGSRVVLANTFGADRLNLGRYKIENLQCDIVCAAIRLARLAAGPDGPVAAVRAAACGGFLTTQRL